MAGSNAFGLKCNKGGDLYTNLTAFLGCCTINPVLTDDSLCPIDKLRPMTFDRTPEAAVPKQACLKGNDLATKWYACTPGTAPPFAGCCAVNPCGVSTCPDAALRPARLSDDDDDASAFIRGMAATWTGSSSSSSSSSGSSNIGGRGTVPYTTYVTSTTTVTVEDPPTSSSSSSAASKTTTTTTTTAMAPSTTTSAAASASDTSVSEKQGMQPTAIAGMAAGIGAGLVVLGLFIFWLIRRRRAAAAAKKEQDTYLAAGLSPPPLPHHQYQHGHAPPGYYAVKPASPPPAELPGNVYYELSGDAPRR